MQALYQWQFGDAAGQDIALEFIAHRLPAGVDEPYFRELVMDITSRVEELDAALGELTDRPVSQLDPVERSALLIGYYELAQRPEVPWRVAISEAVELCRRYGSVDGHRYVNAVLDRAARSCRPRETGTGG